MIPNLQITRMNMMPHEEIKLTGELGEEPVRFWSVFKKWDDMKWALYQRKCWKLVECPVFSSGPKPFQEEPGFVSFRSVFGFFHSLCCLVLKLRSIGSALEMYQASTNAVKAVGSKHCTCEVLYTLGYQVLSMFNWSPKISVFNLLKI